MLQVLSVYVSERDLALFRLLVVFISVLELPFRSAGQREEVAVIGLRLGRKAEIIGVLRALRNIQHKCLHIILIIKIIDRGYDERPSLYRNVKLALSAVIIIAVVDNVLYHKLYRLAHL